MIINNSALRRGRVKYQAAKSDELEYDEHFLSITNDDKNGATEFKTYEKTEW